MVIAINLAISFHLGRPLLTPHLLPSHLQTISCSLLMPCPMAPRRRQRLRRQAALLRTLPPTCPKRPRHPRPPNQHRQQGLTARQDFALLVALDRRKAAAMLPTRRHPSPTALARGTSTWPGTCKRPFRASWRPKEHRCRTGLCARPFSHKCSASREDHRLVLDQRPALPASRWSRLTPASPLPARCHLSRSQGRCSSSALLVGPYLPPLRHSRMAAP